jgi:DNA polymerase-3 subunit beta
MKFRAPRKPLADALTWVASALPKRPANAVLSGIKVHVDGNQLTLSAFDYETGHTARLEVAGLGDGEVLVSGPFLAMVVSQMNGTDVDIALDGRRLAITCGRSSYTAQTMSMADYPNLPDFPPTVGHIDADALTDLITKVVGPVSEDKEDVAGIHLDTDRGDDSTNTLTLVGADDEGRAVHVASCSWAEDGPLDATVPGNRLNAAVKGMRDTITIGHNEGTLGLEDGARTVTMRCYTVPYLRGSWRKVLATQVSRIKQTVEVDGALMASAVKRSGAMSADKDNRLIGVTIDPDAGEVVLASSDYTGGGEEVIEAVPGGDTARVEFGMNAILFGQAITAAGSKVEIGLPKPGGKSGVDGAVVIRPAGDETAAFLVMPRRAPGSIA